MPGVLTRGEIGRRAFGFVAEVGIKAYGAAAAASVALSDAETAGGKGEAAIAAVPNLMERYRDAKYIVEHREEIQASLDYMHQHAPDADELEKVAERSAETLEGIGTTYDELVNIKDALANRNPIEGVSQAFGHLRAAWEARPDLDSIRHLADVAEDVAPFVEHGEVLIPKLYGGLLLVMDNFASDEIAATVGVMVAAILVAYALGTGIGFWARRGRPRLIARTLQRWGARRFSDWYVRHLEVALGKPVVAVARERLIRDIVRDPKNTLDDEALRELERYFESRMSRSR